MQVAITDCLKIRDGSHGSLLNQLREGRTRKGQLVIPHRLNYQQFSHVTKNFMFSVPGRCKNSKPRSQYTG